MPEAKTRTTCPKCNHEFNIKIAVTPEMTVPIVAGKIKPSHQIMVYNITSNDISRYITDVVRSVVPDAVVALYPRDPDKKGKKIRNGYVYLLLGMNERVIEQKQQNSGFYGSLGWQHSVRIRSRLWFDFVKRWLYDQNWINKTLGSYKKLDAYEEQNGLTEEQLKDIAFYSMPKAAYPEGSKTPWVFTAIDPYRVIEDMLCEAGTHKVPGEIFIPSVNRLSEDLIEWQVFVSPFKNEAEINPHVMQILKGVEKAKTMY